MNSEFKIEIKFSANSRDKCRDKLIKYYFKEKFVTFNDVHYYTVE